MMMMIEFYLCYVLILVFEQFYICAYSLMYLLNTYSLIKYSVYPLSLCDKKGEYFLFLVFG
jgi:hypothetical protein